MDLQQLHRRPSSSETWQVPTEARNDPGGSRSTRPGSSGSTTWTRSPRGSSATPGRSFRIEQLDIQISRHRLTLYLPLALASLHQSKELYIYISWQAAMTASVAFIFDVPPSGWVNKPWCVWSCFRSSLPLGILWVLLKVQVAVPGTLDHSSFQKPFW